MKTQMPDVSHVDVDSIKPFVKRSRKAEDFERVKQSIAEVGLKMPIQIRDITTRPADERRRPDGGLYRYELIVGQGRLEAHKELGKKRIAAFILDAPEAEIVGRFLAENMIRKPLPWAEKARMVKAEVDAGSTVEQVAARFFITPGHAYKLLRIISKVAHGAEDDFAALPMLEAEALTTLPAEAQAIVVETLRENPERQARDVLKKARQLTESGESLSKTALLKSLDRIQDDLTRVRQSLKLVRLHHSLGPQNILTLLENKRFRKELESAGVNLTRFESLTK